MANVSPLPSPKEFLKAIFNKWFSLMSGALTVPLGFASYYYPTSTQKAIWGGLALLSVMLTAYSIWSTERAERIKMERLLAEVGEKPRISLTFDGMFAGDSMDTPFGVHAFPKVVLKNTGVRSSVDSWRISVKLKNGTVIPCIVYAVRRRTFDYKTYSITIGPEVDISDLASQPIEPGTTLRGFLHILAPDITSQDAIGATFTVSAEDVWGQTFSGSLVFEKDTSDRLPQFQPGSREQIAHKPQLFSMGYSASFKAD